MKRIRNGLSRLKKPNNGAEAKTTETGVFAATGGEGRKEADYVASRKSVRLWPVEETNLEEGCRAFLRKILCVPEETADALKFEHVERIQQARRSKIHHEVLMVRQPSIEARDLVQS